VERPRENHGHVSSEFLGRKLQRAGRKPRPFYFGRAILSCANREKRCGAGSILLGEKLVFLIMKSFNTLVLLSTLKLAHRPRSLAASLAALPSISLIPFALFYFLLSSSAFPQGSLTPPVGAPAPTMKSLDQIEARTPISSAPFFINSSGSYYLTKNLSVSSGNAIAINSGGVTLDLNGFTLSSTAASPSGSAGIVIASGLRDITILNGHIRGSVTQSGGFYSGSGFGYGIGFNGSAPANTLIFHVSVSGCLNDGINPGASYSTVVDSCTVQTVGGAGIVASAVKASSALECGGAGILGNQISDCWGDSVSTDGIYGTVVQNSYGSSAGAPGVPSKHGIYAFNAQNCYGAAPNATSGDSAGLLATTAQNCYGTANNFGIYATVAANCYGKSTGGSGIGIGGCTIAIACTFSGSGISATHQYFCGSGPAIYP
jgi:hypothetical protein